MIDVTHQINAVRRTVAARTLQACDPPLEFTATWECDGALVGLTTFLSTGEAVDPSIGQCWMASEDGRRFMKLSSEAWYEANVAGGADAEWARSAADRCLAADLGEAKTRTRSSQGVVPEIFSMRCTPRHLSRSLG